MSEQDKTLWDVELDFHPVDRRYTVRGMRPAGQHHARVPYLTVEAEDEIGAFREVDTIMRQLGMAAGE